VLARSDVSEERVRCHVETRLVTTTDAPYETALHKSHVAITIRPNLSDADWSEIKRAGDDILSQIHAHTPKRILVDLTPLDYMGSSLVALVVRCWKEARPHVQQFVVVSDSEVVREVLNLSGLAKMWDVVETREEAMDALGDAERDASRHWITALGAIALLICVAGVGLWYASPPQRPLATWLIYGGAISGAVLGVTLITRANRRYLGLTLVLVCAGAGLFRLLQQ
jgi:anti-anti-sigma factor